MDRKFYEVLNRVFNFQEIQERMQSMAPVQSGAYVKPFITIARDPGSGGRPIAQAVAKALDFEFIDKQLVTEIASSVSRRRAIIKQIDEKGRSAIEDIVHAVLNPEYVNDDIYTRELFKTMLAYAYQGNVVILGRGGNFVTPFAKGLHVRITAPYDVRVKRAIDFEGFDKEKAKQVIAEVEEERRNFVKQYIKRDAKRANSYDISINTNYFQVDQARDIIIEAFYNKFSLSVKRR